MQINESGNMGNNELIKAGNLLVKAGQLGMDVSGYGALDVNTSSGNVYLWLEDYNFTLFIGLGSDAVRAIYSCPVDGEETDRLAGNSLTSLENWASKMADNSEAKEAA